MALDNHNVITNIVPSQLIQLSKTKNKEYRKKRSEMKNANEFCVKILGFKMSWNEWMGKWVYWNRQRFHFRWFAYIPVCFAEKEHQTIMISFEQFSSWWKIKIFKDNDRKTATILPRRTPLKSLKCSSSGDVIQTDAHTSRIRKKKEVLCNHAKSVILKQKKHSFVSFLNR